MEASKCLYELYSKAKSEENSKDYIDELCDQLSFFGTETNKLTREHVLGRLSQIVKSIERTMK
jgi:hypothetical protein